jgi:murein DD-endopeptidase MepM/ murein hydrolase activator NlpD
MRTRSGTSGSERFHDGDTRSGGVRRATVALGVLVLVAATALTAPPGARPAGASTTPARSRSAAASVAPAGLGGAAAPVGPALSGTSVAQQHAGRGAGVAAPGPGAAFRWPLDGPPRPARRFEPPPQPWLPGHRGVDLVAAPAAVVRAAGPGVVLFAGPVAGRPVVSVGHAAGLRTTYEPVRPGVRAGDRVAAGAALGQLLPGHGGCPEPACLHWGLRRGEEYLDPLALLGLGPVRLLPA